MSQALLREKVIMDLWGGKPILATDTPVQEILDGLHNRGYISNTKDNPRLTEKGLDYVLHGRDPSELVELLADVNVSHEERIFLANAIKGMVDKPFAYEIIKTAAGNPDREKYPSVDLGAYDDIEHGLLFGAKTHIMIDPKIRGENIDEIVEKLERFGAVITNSQRKGYGAHVLYRVGDAERELYLVGTEAMKIDRNILRRRTGSGIFALMMKGLGGKKGEFGDVLEALEHYGRLLIEGGLLLTAKLPKLGLKRIGEGMLSYESHVYDGVSGIVAHSLYQKPTKV